MLEFKKRVLEFKLDGTSYQLRYPSVIEIKGFAKTNKDGEDNLDNTIDFLEKLGLKKEVTETLEIEHLKQIIEHLTDQKKT